MPPLKLGARCVAENVTEGKLEGAISCLYTWGDPAVIIPVLVDDVEISHQIDQPDDGETWARSIPVRSSSSLWLGQPIEDTDRVVNLI